MRPHGVMFHHFFDERHPRGQGAISARELEQLLARLGPVVGAREYEQRARSGELRDGDICLTFDDSLRCQIDVALPVLKARGLTAFWFAYTAVTEGSCEKLELYRYFRTVHYLTIDDFYREFWSVAYGGRAETEANARKRGFDAQTYLGEFGFYTADDRLFRFLRDVLWGPEKYHEVMDQMVAASGLNVDEVCRSLWMSRDDLQQLHREGHVIGLHSHTHPTNLAGLSLAAQRDEFVTNREVLESTLGEAPKSMAHPCNSYSAETLDLLRSLGVELGFRSNMATGFDSALEQPREDHSTLMRALGPS